MKVITEIFYSYDIYPTECIGQEHRNRWKRTWVGATHIWISDVQFKNQGRGSPWAKARFLGPIPKALWTLDSPVSQSYPFIALCINTFTSLVHAYPSRVPPHGLPFPLSNVINPKYTFETSPTELHMMSIHCGEYIHIFIHSFIL